MTGNAAVTDIASATTDLDVIIVGAGLSGIAAAHYLRERCPGTRFALLEARQSLGGTWDLFRYPGVRSDSDMFTLGFSFRPWASDEAIADGGKILDYLKDAARAEGLDTRIRYGHKVREARWDSALARWTLDVERSHADGQRDTQSLTCRFLFMCSGYYAYDAGHAPTWPGMDRFGGIVVHPQHWPRDLDYRGKRVVIIGSGATAVTLLPSMAPTAAHVTMLQRSPTYILSMPQRDGLAEMLRAVLPAGVAHRVVRMKNVLVTLGFYNAARRWPNAIRRVLIRRAARQAHGHADIARDLSPRYNPWDQRLCLAPNGDIFKALRSGRASIVTDEIASFTPTGLALTSGKSLDADIIVTATGLRVQLMGGARLSVDGAPVALADTVAYKGMMYSGVPNLASIFGYTNASWTLKAELIAQYVCRLINHMNAHGFDTCIPQLRDGEHGELPAIGLTSGYIRRAAGVLPKQGGRKPWVFYQSYLRDLRLMRWGRIEDGAMRFERRAACGVEAKTTARGAGASGAGDKVPAASR
ncbi:NAD(P)/FAD-dependent oxidoreductase [Pandoraea nosoerga]|uniref:FAD-containing monooxygenase EthA n=1 Tax=Pandoraea nosoerga TaxID=2508296 RepID=A0A5E4X5G5_9BURK|nr:NAD(P)/FAD-dependent oxidoreductase [Pandoraea nosoerga]MBN4665116.1 NAD(P)/FAD-dependent oxidoreductase [Pandoraea nosoerga]MBN4675168.1 NAD(P)/FAD-dependent oxidoreductase [Pandoraea nosoerga]MBN4680859.1 NAD(P)/FAD-dependent oxidoreductase [Pandoraea nosoerga]MBN4744861.1 NAD(P)/FAD-dependent oxidoreductase [Pandoraea nosoerga]VVE31526.1 FAD-containing monooxygenase EthA [Pandoraea nosoerga]